MGLAQIIDLIGEQNNRSGLQDWAKAGGIAADPDLSHLAEMAPRAYEQMFPQIVQQGRTASALSALTGGGTQSQQASTGQPVYGGDSNPTAPVPQTLPAQQPVQPVAPKSPLASMTDMQNLPLYVMASGGNLEQGFKAMQAARAVATPMGATLEPGMMWDPNNPGHAIAIPGAFVKGANGEILTVGSNGVVTQSVPKSPEARGVIESNINKMSGLLDELDKEGGSVSENKTWAQNQLNKALSTEAGQGIMQGSKEQTIKNSLQSIITQSMPIYMQAMGLTPGMERSAEGQKMILDAMGVDPQKSIEANKAALANLSLTAGVGKYAEKNGSYLSKMTQPQVAQPSANQQAANPALLQEMKRRGMIQ